MKILLINPPLTVESVYGKYSDLASFQPPIGLCSLAAYLRANSYRDVRILDASVLLMSIKEVVDEIRMDSVDLIGIYTNTVNFHRVVALLDAIRGSNLKIKIVLGGPHPSCLPKSTLESSQADYCIIGEGEETFLELLQFLDQGGGEPDYIEGLVYRNQSHEVIENRRRERIRDLDSLPFPAIDLLPSLSKYRLYLLQYRKLPYMTVLTSRGCPFNCIFCQTPFGKKVYYNSPEYITEYLLFLSKKFGVKEIHFCDDTFTLDEDRVIKICDLIKRKNLDMSWYAATRATVKNQELFKDMKSAGCWLCAIGAESGNQKIIDLLEKNVTLDQIRSTARAVISSGMILKVFFILGNPNETPETIDNTIKFAKELKAHLPVFSLMTPMPGTKLWETADQYGCLDRSDYERLSISSSDPVFIPHGLTKKSLLDKQQEAFRRVYFTPEMVWRHVSSIRSVTDLYRLSRAGITFLKI